MTARRQKAETRKWVLALVLGLIGLPPLLALAEGISFHLRNRNNGILVSSGDEREYLLHVPETYDPKMPAPLVISLHGGAGWPAMQRELSGWDRLADRDGFLVVYPSGVRLGGKGPRGWRVTRPGPGITKDVRFLSDLIDELERRYSIDPSRIYVNGLSNGAGMTFVLSCALADRIAAVGTVAAAQMLPWSWCAEPTPMPMPLISFHGTADTATPYEGGTSWVGDFSVPPVLEWTENWARRNRCDPEPVESTVAAGVIRLDYGNCALEAAVVLFSIVGGGHTWPGGAPLPEWLLGPTSSSVDATEEMWAFFERHPRNE